MTSLSCLCTDNVAPDFYDGQYQHHMMYCLWLQLNLILTFEPSLIKLFKAFRSLGVILIAHKTARTRIIGQK